jgi:hypothetical protein
VSVPVQIRGHIKATRNAEVIHVHNHPKGFARTTKNLVPGDAPVASDGNREAQQAHEAVAKGTASQTFSERHARFFVGDRFGIRWIDGVAREASALHSATSRSHSGRSPEAWATRLDRNAWLPR